MNNILTNDKTLADFLTGKSQYAVELFFQLANEVLQLGTVVITVKKTMIAFEANKSFLWVVYFGKDFLDVVLPFTEKHENNLCFNRIKQVPGTNQFNHYLRIYLASDINDEVRDYFLGAFNNTK